MMIKRCFEKLIDHYTLYFSSFQSTFSELRFQPFELGWKWNLERHFLRCQEELLGAKYRHFKDHYFTVYNIKRPAILASQMKDGGVHNAIFIFRFCFL
jgi:hypothetical protein